MKVTSDADPSKIPPRLSRRRALRWLTGAGLAGLAGCAAGGDEAPATEPAEPATESPTASPTPTPTPIPTPVPGKAVQGTSPPWPMFAHDPLNSGSERTTTGPQSAVGVAWQFETGNRVRTAPAVVDGGLFVGSDDGFVYGLDAISGAEQWSFETGGAVVSSPAVVDGTVFVGSNDGNVYALTADSGTEQWRFETGGPVRSSPAVGEGHVYVGSDDGFVYGLHAATGESKGEQNIGGEVTAGPCVEIYNAHNDPNVFIGNSRGELYVLWIESHRFMEKRASLPLGGAIHSSMASGQSPVGDGENVMFGTDDGTVFSIKVPRSGEFKTGGRVRGSPAVDLGNGQFYIGSGDGSIYALTIADGDLVWKTETGGEVQSSPALAGDTVYVGSDDGAVYGLAAKNGQERWRYVTDDKIRSSPAVVDGAVFIGSDDGTVYALTERH